MVTLKPVLSVREIPPVLRVKRDYFPSIHDYIAEAPISDEQHLLTYLRQGVVCDVHYDSGLCRDVINPPTKIPDVGVNYTDEMPSVQPNALMTDGVWLWPAALIYYVEKYHVQLDADFLTHAQQSNWRIDRATILPTTVNTEWFDRVEGQLNSRIAAIRGHVKNGIVVLEDGKSLPEGTEVIISCLDDDAKNQGKRVEFPLVHSPHPASVDLTNQRIGEILDDEDTSPRQ